MRILFNVNIIYFLLCCIYGVLLLSMEWSLIFFYQKCWNVLHCILHSYCGIVPLTSWPLQGQQGFYLKKSVEEAGPFYGLFYYVCSLCILLCFPLPQLARASSDCTSTSWTTCAEQPSQGSQLPSELRLIMPFESFALHPWHTQRTGHWEAQTGINSGCKACVSSAVAFVHVFCLCTRLEHVTTPFSFLEYFSYCIKTFFNCFTDFMPYATDLLNENCHLLVNGMSTE